MWFTLTTAIWRTTMYHGLPLSFSLFLSYSLATLNVPLPVNILTSSLLILQCLSLNVYDTAVLRKRRKLSYFKVYLSSTLYRSCRYYFISFVYTVSSPFGNSVASMSFTHFIFIVCFCATTSNLCFNDNIK